MSNKTQLQQNNLEYDSLIELLSGKSIGSNVSLQEKTITPTTSSQTVEPDDGYDGFSKVTVDAIPTTTQATPTISVDADGLITASTTQNSGYVTAGTQYTTKQLPKQAGTTITPSTSQKVVVSSGYFTTGTVYVGAIPSSYVKPIYTKGTTTYTPTTSNQTIASGTYLNGTQTIKGDTNLIAGNIKSGISIFGVTGSYGGSGDSGDNTIQCLNTYVVFNDTVLFNVTPDVLTFNADGYQIRYFDDNDTEGMIQNLTISIDDTDAVTIAYQIGEAPLLTVYSSDTGWVEDYYKTIMLNGDVPVALIEILCGIATISTTPSAGGGSFETVDFSLQTSIPYIMYYNTLVNGVVTQGHYIKNNTASATKVFTVLKDVWLEIIFITSSGVNTSIDGGEYTFSSFPYVSSLQCERVKFTQDGSISCTPASSGAE